MKRIFEIEWKDDGKGVPDPIEVDPTALLLSLLSVFPDTAFCVENITKQPTASEALYGFMGWLTTRGEKLCVGHEEECGVVADLVNRFCTANKLSEPRENWIKLQVPMKEDPAEDVT